MNHRACHCHCESSRGYALLSLVLVTLVMVGAITAVVMRSSLGSVSVEHLWNDAIRISSQADFLRGVLIDCGNRGGNNGSASYPLYPLSNATGSTAGPCFNGAGCSYNSIAVTATTLVCPSHPNRSLISGVGGAFLSPLPAGLSAWRYINSSADGVLFYIQNVSGGVYGQQLLAKAATQIQGSALKTITVSNDALVVTVLK